MQRVDIDEEYVAVLVDELDGLVRLAVLVDLHQPVEPAHAVVDVHHVVARPQLVQFGNGHLLVAANLAVDAVALVAVEDLVVGIEAQLQVVVHKPLVQRRRNGPHDGLTAADLVEDVLQALDLRLVLRKYIGVVPPQGIADHVVGKHLEVLVELRLRGGREGHLCRGGTLCDVVAQQEETACSQVGEQSVAARQQAVDAFGLLHVCKRAAPHVVHAPQHIVGIVEPEGGIRTGKAGQRDPRGTLHRGVQVGDDLHALEFVGRKLARDVEAPDRIDLVAEEIQTVGLALRKGEDIDDAAAHGVLPRLVNKIDAREGGIDQLLFEHLDRDPVANPHGYRPAVERLGINDPLGQHLGIGADHQIALARKPAQGIHRRRTLHDTLRVLDAVGRRMFVGRGEEADPLLVEQVVEVVEQIGGRIAVLGHEDVDTATAGHDSRGIERKGAADQLLEMDGRTGFLVFTAQSPEILRSGGKLRQLLTGGHNGSLGLGRFRHAAPPPQPGLPPPVRDVPF